MTEPKDPERLLAEALRAQAVFAPQAERTSDSVPGKPEVTDRDTETLSTAGLGAAGSGGSGVAGSGGSDTTEPGTAALPPQYGLLSGAGAESLERERAALDSADAFPPAEAASNSASTVTDPPTVRQTLPKPVPAPLPVYWVLVLAILLGLAAGSVVGLLTLL